jgi:hypothetical protein
LARHLAASGITVIEVDRPNRQEGRRNGKSDELDAIEAARAALCRRAKGHAKGGTGNVEALRALLVAKRSARSIRIRSTGQLRPARDHGPRRSTSAAQRAHQQSARR